MTPGPQAGDPLAVVILAGGRSRRLGRDKRLLGVGDVDLLSDTWNRVARLGLPSFVAVAADQSDGLPLLPGLAILHDQDPGAGPLAALCAVIHHLGMDTLLLAADLPEVGTPTLVGLLEVAARHPGCAVVPSHARGLEPLCALYPRAVHSALVTSRSAGESSLQRALQALDPPSWVAWEVAPRPFRNLNEHSQVVAWRSE